MHNLCNVVVLMLEEIHVQLICFRLSLVVSMSVGLGNNMISNGRACSIVIFKILYYCDRHAQEKIAQVLPLQKLGLHYLLL